MYHHEVPVWAVMKGLHAHPLVVFEKNRFVVHVLGELHLEFLGER